MPSSSNIEAGYPVITLTARRNAEVSCTQKMIDSVKSVPSAATGWLSALKQLRIMGSASSSASSTPHESVAKIQNGESAPTS